MFITQRAWFSEAELAKAVALLDSIGEDVAATAVVLWWSYLLRVQSEGQVVYKGEPEHATHLPPDWANSIWRDRQGGVWLKLQRRKNRPRGSLLPRPCTCDHCPGLCVAHRVEGLLGRCQVGQPLRDMPMATVM